MIPEIRLETDMVGELAVGFTQKRLLRSLPKHLWARLLCRWRGHDWSPWNIDDMEGPTEVVDGVEIPLLSRESRPGEFGMRVCRQRCGASETRYPIAEAPALWQDAVLRNPEPAECA